MLIIPLPTLRQLQTQSFEDMEPDTQELQVPSNCVLTLDPGTTEETVVGPPTIEVTEPSPLLHRVCGSGRSSSEENITTRHSQATSDHPELPHMVTGIPSLARRIQAQQLQTHTGTPDSTRSDFLGTPSSGSLASSRAGSSDQLLGSHM